MSSVGPSVSYRFSPRVELWSEASFIFKNLYANDYWKNLKGFRFIFQPRIYLNKTGTFFMTPEFRIKQFSYNSSLTFINKTTTDTLWDYSHESSQVLIGGGLVFGHQFALSKQHNFFMEITFGVGGKQRYIQRKNIPQGYQYYPETGGFGLRPHYEWNNDGTGYFPFGLRLFWKLNQR